MANPPLYGFTRLSENRRVINWMRRVMAWLFLVVAPANLFAGGSGLNVAVVVNQNSTNSVQLGNYYCERRGVPPQNLLRIDWSGSIVEWSKTDFTNTLLNPLVAMLASRQLTNQVEYVVLSMDIPYRVTNTTGTVNNNVNSTTAALFYGFKNNPADPLLFCSLAGGSTSAYAGSEGIFRQTPPINASSNSWLVMMLTSSNLAQAKAVVDRGVISDNSFPTQTVYLVHNDFDPSRGVRYLLYDDAIFDNRLRAVEKVVRTNAAYPSFPGYQLGSQFGLSSFSIPPDIFAPGAMADNLTSFGGLLFEAGHHPGPLEYLIAGATASYGTVVEPCNYFEKFAAPRNYFYQSRGFSIAECYYQSVTNPYQGILVGEPLAAPFALPGSGAWSGLPAGAIFSGTTNLALQFDAPDAGRPVQQVDLFLDGNYLRTLTNIAPLQSNKLYVTLNGSTTNYTVPASATLKSITSNLTVILNTPALTNATKVIAFPHGDRIELRSTELATPGDHIPVTVSNFIGSASALTTSLAASRTNFLDTAAQGWRNFVISNAPLNNTFLQLAVTKTNGSSVTLSVTNPPSNTNGSVLVKMLVDAINTNATLLAADGVVAEDYVPYEVYLVRPGGEFNLYARSGGWSEAQIQAHLTGSVTFGLFPSANVTLEENINDLSPRNHLYVTAGATNLTFTFPLNTTTNADGYHELTAVAYEGSHVRTQTRATQSVRITNSTLAATFNCLLGGTNTALEATLQFSVVANTNSNIAKIVLCSTGGAQATVSNQPSANFSLAATNLGIGLHPFYALVTRNGGQQYRTETKWIRIIGSEPPFTLGIAGSAPTVIWPATAGRRYEILSATNSTNALTLRDAVAPTNSTGLWSETNNAAAQQLYRVRAVP